MSRSVVLALACVAAVLTSCGGTNAQIEGPGSPGTLPPKPTPAATTTIPTPTAPGAHSEFSVGVTTDRESYATGESVTFTVEICNRGPATTTEGYGGSDIPFSYQILDEQDEVVADDSHALRTTELRMVRWSEGRCRTAQASWDQHYWNRAEDRPSEPPEVHGTPQRGDLVPPGGYRIRVDSSHGRATSNPFELQRQG